MPARKVQNKKAVEQKPVEEPSEIEISEVIDTAFAEDVVETEPVKTEVKQEVVAKKPRQPRKPSQKKTEEKEGPFSPAVITNFLNNKYGTNNTLNNCKIVFKNWSDKSKLPTNCNIIDINEYNGVKELIYRWNELSEQEAKDPKVTQTEKAKDVIKRIFNFDMRAILDILLRYDIKPFKDSESTEHSKYSVFVNEVIDRIGFPKQSNITLEEYFARIDRFFENSDKLKTKVFNNSFPHGRHDKLTKVEVDKDPSLQNAGVKNIYLQHIPKYHDLLLSQFIENGRSVDDCIKLVRKEFVKQYAPENTPDLDVVRNSMFNPAIISAVLSDKKRSDIDLNINELVRWDGKAQKAVCDENGSAILIGASEKKAIRCLIRELNISYSFLRIIAAGATYDHIEVKDLVGNMKKYMSITSKLENYGKNELVKGERATFDDFVFSFIKTLIFVKSTLEYNSPLKQFMKEIGVNTLLKFNKDFRSGINKFVEVPRSDAEIRTFVEEHKQYIKSLETQQECTCKHYYDQCAKIGLYSETPFPKYIRAGIGCAILKYIQDNVKLIRAGEKKRSELAIYIKC